MIDLEKLDYREFENLVGLLLARESHEIVREPSLGSRGPDYETMSPDGHSVLVEVKRLRRWQTAGSDLARLAGDVERYRQQKLGARGLLVLSCALSEAEKLGLSHNFANIDIWDGKIVGSLLAKHKEQLRGTRRQTPQLDNTRRLHSALGYLSPAQFEDDHARQTVKTAA